MNGAYEFVALIVHSMQESDDSGIGSRATLTALDDFAFDAQRIVNEHRLGEGHLTKTEIDDERAEGSVLDGYAGGKRDRVQTVHDALTKLGALRVFRVEMKWLWIMRARTEQYIVCLRYCSVHAMRNHLTNFCVVVIESWHGGSPSAISYWRTIRARRAYGEFRMYPRQFHRVSRPATSGQSGSR